MSRQILFNEGTVLNGTSWADAIAGNAIPLVNCFDVDNIGDDSLDLTEAINPSIKRIQFTQRPKVGETPILSPVINVKDVHSVKKTAYVAPAAQVTTVTAATISGDEPINVRLKVIKVSEGFRPEESFSVVVDVQGKTANDIATAFRNAINNHRGNKFISADVSNSAIVLTADLGVSFSTAIEGASWTVTATTSPNFGSGTFAQVSNVEKESIARGGFYYQTYLPVQPPTYANSTKTYDLYVLQIKTTTTPNISVGHEYYDLYLAVEAGGTGIDLEEFFNGVWEE